MGGSGGSVQRACGVGESCEYTLCALSPDARRVLDAVGTLDELYIRLFTSYQKSTES